MYLLMKEKGRPQPDNKEIRNEREESTGSHVWRRANATSMAHGSMLTKAGMHITLGLAAFY